MTRIQYPSAIGWRAWAALAAAMAVMSSAATAIAELELKFSAPFLFEETAERVNLLFPGRLQDNGEEPVPDVDQSFSSFEWQLDDGTRPPFSVFDRPTLSDQSLVINGRPQIPDGEPLWSFEVGLSTEFQKNPDGTFGGVRDLVVALSGQHLVGPHDDDVNPNRLPSIFTKNITADVGARIRSKGAVNKRAHPTIASQADVDRYALRVSFGVLDSIEEPLSFVPNLPNNIRIFANHVRPPPASRPGEPPKKTAMTFGSSQSFAFFDDGEKTGEASLIFSTGLIDTARSQPVSSGGGGAQVAALAEGASLVDPQFAGDPLLDGSVFILQSGINQVPYLGFDADRAVDVFGGATLSISTSADFTFEATFPELLYDRVSDEFFATLETVTYTDLLNTDPSIFLDIFTDAHSFGDDPSSRGMQLTFKISGFDEATSGFTESFGVVEPFGMYLTGILIPEPATAMLLGIGGGLHMACWAGRRRNVAGPESGMLLALGGFSVLWRRRRINLCTSRS